MKKGNLAEYTAVGLIFACLGLHAMGIDGLVSSLLIGISTSYLGIDIYYRKKAE